MDKELRIEFERVAANGGYSMDRTNDGAYEDQWLQNASTNGMSALTNIPHSDNPANEAASWPM